MKITRETLLIGLIGVVLAFFPACGGSTSSNSSGGGGTTPPAISVAISSPPTSVTAGQSAQFMATVANDSANGGVAWSCTPANSCGSFSPAKTASGSATTYTAPSTAGSVTIVATSATNTSVTATATVTINAAQSGAISIKVSGPTSLAPSATGTFTATVTNDSAAKGVAWSCTPSGSCGTFSPQSGTGNSVATTYTAPATVPSGGSATIVATSQADGKTTGTATVSITGAASTYSLAAGTYIFNAIGEDAGGHTYGVVGAVQLDGNGNVTGGEQDYDNAGGAGGIFSPETNFDTIESTGGSYTVSSTDGHGTLTIQSSNTTEGKSGLETFAISVVNSKHALITQFDSTATSSGSLDLQTSGITQAQLAGSYAFQLTGFSAGASYSQGGVITLDGSGNWSSMVTDFNEEDGSVTIKQGTTQTGGTNIQNEGTPFSGLDGNGRGTAYFGGIYFSYYAVTPKVIRLLGYYPQTGNLDALFFGSMFSQGSTAGFNANPELNGTYAFTDSSVHTIGTFNQTYGAAGILTLNNGAVTGFMDVNQTGITTFSPAAKSGAVTGTYNLTTTTNTTTTTTTVNGTALVTITQPSGTISQLGLYLVDPTVDVLDPNNTQTGTTPSALLVDLDGSTNGPNFVGAGLLIPQTATAAGTGELALNMQGFNSKGEVDSVGPVKVAAGNAVSGTIAVNDLLNTATQDASVTFAGTLTADASNAGRYTLTNGTSTYAIYEIDTGDYVLVETDSALTGVGTLQSK